MSEDGLEKHGASADLFNKPLMVKRRPREGENDD